VLGERDADRRREEDESNAERDDAEAARAVREAMSYDGWLSSVQALTSETAMEPPGAPAAWSPSG